MTLQERLAEWSAQLRDRAAICAEAAAAATRAGMVRAAVQAQALDGPVEALASASLELNRISADYVAKLLTEQAAASRAVLRAAAAGLRELAEADSVTQAWRTQRARLVEAAPRAVVHLRQGWDLSAEAGRAVAELATSTYRKLREAGPPPRRTRRRKAAGSASAPGKSSSARHAAPARRRAGSARTRRTARTSPAVP